MLADPQLFKMTACLIQNLDPAGHQKETGRDGLRLGHG